MDSEGKAGMADGANTESRRSESISAALWRLELDSMRVAAKTFVWAKGRLPLDSSELVEWLLEFTRYTGEMLRLTQESYLAHMQICAKPSPLFFAVDFEKKANEVPK
jgi:ferric-dicitrate binding protein FerR (iron transport regulator)